MRSLIIIAALLFSAAGLAETTQALNATAKTGSMGTATVAQFGTWEMSLAPQYTRMSVIDKQATRLLRAEKISVETAQAIHDRSVTAHKLLDQSWRGDKLSPTAIQRLQLRYASEIIDEAAALLKEVTP